MSRAILKMTCFFPVDLIQQGKSNNKRTVSMVSDLTQVERACSNLQEKLTLVLEYVEEVLVSYGELTFSENWEIHMYMYDCTFYSNKHVGY